VLAFGPIHYTPISTHQSRHSQNTRLHAVTGQIHARPIGIGSAAPKTIITNVDLEGVVDTQDEWIQTRTGIAQRHVLLDGESIRDLGVEASRAALQMAGVDAKDLDMVICCSSTPEDLFGDAPTIASELGCTTDTVAFDLTAACSGFLFGTITAAKFLTGSNVKKTALVVGADAMTRWVDWDDRNTCILFGDGAGAMVLETSGEDEEGGILGSAMHSNGKGSCDLSMG
jgi:3-oxoacyl-[acyl-carrier-protein] synthase-3